MLRALDLFSGAGGAARGLQQTGYHVTGVDIKPQPRYAGDVFIQADAMAIDWTGYDLIWASPPCQRYSRITPANAKNNHPDLLPDVLSRLREQPTPYICENVDGTQHMMKNPLFLCGSMFGLDLWRHRWFELGNTEAFFLLPTCNHSVFPVLITGTFRRKGIRRREYLMHEKKNAIEIDWMTGKELDDAIPPAYSRFLATAMKDAL